VKASIIFVILNYSTHPPSALMVKDNAVKATRTSKCRLKTKKLKPPIKKNGKRSLLRISQHRKPKRTLKNLQTITTSKMAF